MAKWKWWYRLEDLEDLLENSHDLRVDLPRHYLVMGHVFKAEEFEYEMSARGRAKWIIRFARCIQKDVWYASLEDILTIIGFLLKLHHTENAYTRFKEVEMKSKWSYEDVHSFRPLETAARELGMSGDDVKKLRKRIQVLVSLLYPYDYKIMRECNWLMGEIVSHTEASTVRMTRDFFSNLKNSLRKLQIYGASVFGSGIKWDSSSSCWEALCEAVATHPSLDGLELHHIDVMESVDDLAQFGNALASRGCMVRSLWLGGIQIHLDGLKCFFQHLSGSKLKTMELRHIYMFRLETDRNLTNDIHLNNVKLGLEELRIYGVHDYSVSNILQFVSQLIQSPNQHLVKLEVDHIRRMTPGLKVLLDAVPRSKVEELRLEGQYLRKILYDRVGKVLQDPDCKLTCLWIKENSMESFPRTFCEGVIKSTTIRSLQLCTQSFKLGLEGQAQFGDAIKMSRLTELKLDDYLCTLSFHQTFLEGILASGLKNLKIHVSQENLEIICRLLVDNPVCNIENMELVVKYDLICKRILEVLDGNYSSQLQNLSFPANSKTWEEKAEQILKRNKLFKIVTPTPVKQAEAGNLYLCGSTGAGKTTIKCNLTRKFNLTCFPACLQQHESTSGIELKHLSFPGTTKKLLIWDLAGQREFHVFHHSFLRGSENSIFLLVLKVARDTDSSVEFQNNVVYWLRFISSHTSSFSLRKPKVLIVLNFFDLQPSPDTYVAESVKRKMTEYKEILDIDLDDIFSVIAKKPSYLKALKIRLGTLCEDLISSQHKIPGLYQDAKKLCRQLKQTVQIKATNELGEKLLAGQQNMTVKDKDKEEMIKFTMSYLHDIGEVVYFNTTNLFIKDVILDVQWFVGEVISLFIDAKTLGWWNKEHQQVNLAQVADHLKKHYGGNKVEFILGCLYEMGIILPMDENWNGDWTPLPMKVIIPELIPRDKVYFSEFPDGDGYKYWGRRMECEDVKFKLFPAGIFARIQARIHEECKNPSFDVGDGWVIFQDNRCHVLISIGGDTNTWKDRQWVDIMVMTHDPFGAGSLVKKMNSCIVECCFGELEIAQQKVLSSMYIKGRIHGGSNSHSQDAVHLSVIEDEAIEHGLKYSHTWGWQRDDLVSDLLFPSEQEKCAKEIMIELCNDYQSLVRVVYDSPPLNSSIPSVPTDFKDDEMQKLANLIGEMSRWQERRTREQLIELTSKFEGLAKQIHANTSRLLHSLRVDCPKYPFLVTRDNRFMRYLKLFTSMKLVKIQYMCEFDYGAHAVTDVDGITLTISPEWLRRWSPVLIPSLIVLFTAAKVGTFFIPGAMFMNGILEESKKGMLEFLKGNVVMKDFDVKTLKESKPTQNDLKEMFVTVQKQSGVTMMMFETETMMRKNFGLTWSPTAGAWLCDEHLRHVTS